MEEKEIFETELAAYEKEKDRLVAENEGHFVVIHGNEIIGTWDTYEDALKSGYEKMGLKRFLVKQIQGIDQIHFFTRDLALCRS